MHPQTASTTAPRTPEQPATVLAWTLFLVPALGVPSELMLQDTLKSTVVVFGVLAAALLFFWQQRHRSAPLQWHGLVWLPITLMVYALGSMLWSHTYLAAVEAIRWFILGLLLWLGLNTTSREKVPALLWGIHAGAVVASVWTALQFWLGWGLFPQGAAPASTFVNRNFFAEYVVCTLPFSAYLLANLRQSRYLPWLAGSISLNVVALMMTGTRSALVAMWVLTPVVLVIWVKYRPQLAWMQWRKSERMLVGLVFVAGVLGLGSVPTGNPMLMADNIGTTALQRSFARTASIAKPAEYTVGSFSIRSVMWRATARMMLANPWAGVGAGAWEVHIPLYQHADTTLETDYYAHNEFLQLLSEYGLPAGGLYLSFLLAYLLITAGNTWRLEGADLAEAPLRSVTLACLLALLIVSNAGFPWHLASCGALLALCLALLAGSDARLGHRQTFFAKALPWTPARSRAALALLLCCSALAIYITRQAATAEQQLVRAIQLADSLRQPQRAGMLPFADRKTQALQNAREGIAINPHYRKLTSDIAEPFGAGGDWESAVWILESIAASRPHVAAIWTGLAMGHSQLGQHAQAQQALSQVQRLRPQAADTRTLEVVLLSNAGREEQAVRMLNTYFDRDEYDFDMAQAGYAIGYKTQHWALAIRSLELRNKAWPDQAADGYLRLGKLYAEPAVQDDAKALAAFKAGLNAVPEEEKTNFRNQVPAPYQARM